MVDDSFSVIGIIDEDALAVVQRPLRELQQSGALRFVIGSQGMDGAAGLGPDNNEAYNTLAWLLTGQLLALGAARARGIDCDSPRGLTKALVTE